MKRGIVKYNYQGDPKHVRYCLVCSDDDWASAYDDSGSYLWVHDKKDSYLLKEITVEQLEDLLNS